MEEMTGGGSLRDGFYYLDSYPKTHGWLKQAYHTMRSNDFCSENLTLTSMTEASFVLFLLQCMLPLFLHNNVSKSGFLCVDGGFKKNPHFG